MGKLDIFSRARMELADFGDYSTGTADRDYVVAEVDEIDLVIEKDDVVLSPYELEYERKLAAAYTLMETGDIEGYEKAMQELKEWEQNRFDTYELEFAYKHEVSVSDWINCVKKKER